MSDIEKLRDTVIAAALADLEAAEALHALCVEPMRDDMLHALDLDAKRTLARAAMFETSIAHAHALRTLRTAMKGGATK